MPSRSTRIRRLASRASVLAALALPGGIFAQTPPVAPGAEISRRVEIVDGREVIAIRARLPLQQPAPVEPVATPPPAPPSIADLLEDQRRAAKNFVNVTLTATVYAGSPVLTELRWTAAGRDWIAYSNVDFGALSQVTNFETADTVFEFSPMVTDGDATARPNPPGLTFSGPEAEYLVYASQADWAAAPEAFTALDLLHSYYEEHRTQLDIALAIRRAEAARLAAEPPAPPKPHVVRYYVPEPAPVATATTASQGGAE